MGLSFRHFEGFHPIFHSLRSWKIGWKPSKCLNSSSINYNSLQFYHSYKGYSDSKFKKVINKKFSDLVVIFYEYQGRDNIRVMEVRR